MTNPATETDVTAEPSPSDDNDLLYAALTSEVDRGVEDFGAVLAADAAPPVTSPVAPTDPEASADKPAPDDTPKDAEQDAEAPAPDGDEAATATPSDPFAALMQAGKPLTYTVDRQPRTFDGILEIEGKGALIPADKLADVRDRLAREESNAAFTKDLYAEKQRYEQHFGGYEAIVQKLESSAQINAAALHIMDALSKSRDAQGNIALDAYSYQLLVKEAGLKAKEAQWEYRTEREQAQQQHASTAADAQVRETAIPTAVRSFMDEPAYKGKLTEADIAAAERHFAPFADALMFKVTPEQAQQWGVKPGTPMVNRAMMQSFFDDRIALRAERTQAATADAARKDAAKFNAPVAKPAALPPRRKDGTFKPSNGTTKTQATQTPKLSLGQLKRLALAGKPIPGDDDYVGD